MNPEVGCFLKLGLPLALQEILTNLSFLFRVPLSYLFRIQEGATLFDIGLAIPATSIYGIVFFTIWYMCVRKKLIPGRHDNGREGT